MFKDEYFSRFTDFFLKKIFYAELPLEPSLSRTLMEANNYGCISEALTVAAMLSAETALLPAAGRRLSYQGILHIFNYTKKNTIFPFKNALNLWSLRHFICQGL